MDSDDERPYEPQKDTMIQLGPGGDNDVDLDEINAYLQRGQHEDQPPEPRDDKSRAVAVPLIAIFNQGKQKKDDANALLKAAKYEEALIQYHRGIWVLMDGEDDFTGEKQGITKANTGKGKGTDHFANADYELKDKVRELRIALHSNAALCALKLKKFKEARIVAEFVIEQDIQNVKGLYRLAQAYEGLGEWKNGVDTLQIILDVEPGNAAAKDMQIRMNQELKKEKKKEKAKYAGMFNAMSKEAKEGDVLYKPEDVKAESERTRAARRKEEIAQGPRRWVLNLPEMSPWEREHASRRFQTSSEGEDVCKMAEGLPKEATDRVKEMYAAGIAKEEIEAMAYCEHLCCKLFTPNSREKLRDMLEDKPEMSELTQAACRLAIEDTSFCGEEFMREALALVHDNNTKEAWNLIEKKRADFQGDFMLDIYPREEAANMRHLKELKNRGAPENEVEPIAQKALEMKEARIRSSLTDKGKQELKTLEDSGASKEELVHFMNVCERGWFDEFMATKYKDLQSNFAKVVEAYQQQLAQSSSSGQGAGDATSSGQQAAAASPSEEPASQPGSS